MENPRKSAEASYHGMLHMQKIAGHDEIYGKPPPGSKTEYRGKSAGVHISREIIELCEVICQIGSNQHDGTVVVMFGNLFEAYTKISNKLVGMLMRARNQNLLTFEGEMLFQRRDDHVPITLLRMPDELIEDTNQRQKELQQHLTAKK